MTAAPVNQVAAPAGLGGWLILVGMGLVVAPLRLGVFVLQNFPSIFGEGVWEALTTPGSDQYHPLWAPLLIFEVVGNVGLLLASLALLILFFNKSRSFPPIYIALAFVNLGFVMADAWLGSFVVTDVDRDTARAIGQSLGGVLIWVPYMRLSKRVKNTFVAKAALMPPVDTPVPARSERHLAKLTPILVAIFALLGAFYAVRAGMRWYEDTTDVGNRALRTLPTPTIAARATPATVTILTFGAQGDTLGQGSGFLVRSSGVIVTNWHVLVGAHAATVLLESGERFERVLFLAGDSTRDVALIQIPGAGLPVLATRDDLPQVGSRVVVIGSPLGLSRTVTEGVISAVRQVQGQSLVQISAPISHGSSGGPVLDDRGRAFAIASASLAEGQQLNFSVPLRHAMELLEVTRPPRPLRAAPTARAAAEAAAGTKIGDFYFVTHKDPIDDTSLSFAYTPSVNKTETRDVALAWRCFSDGLNVSVTLGQYFEGDGDDRIRVRYRIDAGQPSEVHDWTLSESHRSAFIAMTEVWQFTERAMQGHKVVIRVADPYDGETHTDEFSLRGLTESLGRLLPCR